jgi:hypothetical protein
MTEDEAKTKWCPMVRVIAYNGTYSSNRLDSSVMSKKCIASNCMLWRWLHPEYVRGTEADKGLSGYCGLGGKP